MPKTLVIHPERCTACRACELACSMKHYGEFNPSRSRIQVNIFLEEAVYIPTTCTQCDQAWCAKICPTTAITRDPRTMAFVVQDNKCVGCKMCVLACPFGSINLFPEKGKAEKCDHCVSIDGDPECVKFCTPKALEYLDEDNEVRLRQIATAQKLKKTYVENYEEVTV
jgi:anaerobic carbon-monoxide dehydrogenase iron sulfur subunit